MRTATKGTSGHGQGSRATAEQGVADHLDTCHGGIHEEPIHSVSVSLGDVEVDLCRVQDVVGNLISLFNRTGLRRSDGLCTFEQIPLSLDSRLKLFDLAFGDVSRLLKLSQSLLHQLDALGNLLLLNLGVFSSSATAYGVQACQGVGHTGHIGLACAGQNLSQSIVCAHIKAVSSISFCTSSVSREVRAAHAETGSGLLRIGDISFAVGGELSGSRVCTPRDAGDSLRGECGIFLLFIFLLAGEYLAGGLVFDVCNLHLGVLHLYSIPSSIP